MKIEEQVITLEQAKLLLEKGLNSPSAWSWVHNRLGWKLIPKVSFMVDPAAKKSYPAYGIAEIMRGLAIMPFYTIDDCGYRIEIGRITKHLVANHIGESAGSLLIHLIDIRNLMVETFNERLKK